LANIDKLRVGWDRLGEFVFILFGWGLYLPLIVRIGAPFGTIREERITQDDTLVHQLGRFNSVGNSPSSVNSGHALEKGDSFAFGFFLDADCTDNTDFLF
jgi:hypothetical protein